MPLASSRRPAVLLVLAAIVVSACGDSGTESGIEQLIESQGGGDVDVDLQGEGGFSVQTDEGGVSIDEDGNMVITDADGSTVTGNVDGESGEMNVESEDGSFRIDVSGDVPEEWPDEVPRPDGIDGMSSTVQETPDELAITLTGQGPSTFVDDYGSTLVDAGYEQTSNFESQDNATRVFDDGTWTVSINSFADGDDTQVAVSLFPSGS